MLREGCGRNCWPQNTKCRLKVENNFNYNWIATASSGIGFSCNGSFSFQITFPLARIPEDNSELCKPLLGKAISLLCLKTKPGDARWRCPSAAGAHCTFGFPSHCPCLRLPGNLGRRASAAIQLLLTSAVGAGTKFNSGLLSDAPCPTASPLLMLLAIFWDFFFLIPNVLELKEPMLVSFWVGDLNYGRLLHDYVVVG